MTDIWLSGVITEDHKLIVDVPTDIPPGRVDVMIQSAPADDDTPLVKPPVPSWQPPGC